MKSEWMRVHQEIQNMITVASQGTEAEMDF